MSFNNNTVPTVASLELITCHALFAICTPTKLIRKTQQGVEAFGTNPATSLLLKPMKRLVGIAG